MPSMSNKQLRYCGCKSVFEEVKQEPTFTIRASDGEKALSAMTAWQLGCIEPGTLRITIPQEKYDESVKALQAMADWQRELKTNNG